MGEHRLARRNFCLGAQCDVKLFWWFMTGDVEGVRIVPNIVARLPRGEISFLRENVDDDAGRGRRVREGRASARRSRGERDGAGTDHLGVGDQQVGWIDLSPRVRRGGRARGDARDAIGRQRDAAVGERVALDARDRAKGFADAWVRWDRERGVRYV